MVYRRFCSFSFALRHSLKPVFPCVPRLSVAVYVVRRIDVPEEHPTNTTKRCVIRLIFTFVFLRFKLQFPIDFFLLIRYCVACESPAKH